MPLADCEVVVSMTTFPARLGAARVAGQSILRQCEASRAGFVIVLSAEQFAEGVPKELADFQDRGVEVIFDPGDIRSYKKLIPVLDLGLSRPVITADDDVVYPDGWLATLMSAHRAAPATIWGTRGTEISWNGVEAAPYVEWAAATINSPCSNVFLTGMGGILYPAGSLHMHSTDRALAQRLCPTADDIWFKAMSLLEGSEVRRLASTTEYPSIRPAQNYSLRRENVGLGANDVQFSAVMNYFGLWDELYAAP